jgi:hypothetical protein
MFRAIVLPIFRSIRLCDTACGINDARSNKYFKKIKFRENPFNKGRVGKCGQKEGDTQTKSIAAFRNFAEAPKKE